MVESQPDGLSLIGAGSFQTKQEMVYATLRLSIVNLYLKPGQRLIIRDVAKRLNVSAVPVREALLRLEAEGLVTIVPHSGATVAEFTPEMVEVHYVARGVLEALADSYSAKRISDAQLDELDRLSDVMVEAMNEQDYARWDVLNVEFHDRILRACGIPQLINMVATMREQGPRYRYFPRFVEQIVSDRMEDHQELLDALREHDAERVEAIQRDHSRLSGKAFRAFLELRQSERDGNGEGRYDGDLVTQFADSKGW